MEWIEIAFSVRNFEELLSKIAADTKSSVCFRMPNGGVFVASEDVEFMEDVETYPLQELFRGYLVDRVADSDTLLGYLVTCKSSPLLSDSSLRNVAMQAIKIYAIRRRSDIERRLSVTSDILRRLLTRNGKLSKIMEALDDHPFPLDQNSLVAVIGFKKMIPDREQIENKILANLEERFSRFFRRYMSWHEKQRLVIAVTPQFPMDDNTTCDFIAQTIENLKEIYAENEVYSDICLGIGSCKVDLQFLPESYEEANRAFRVAVLGQDTWWLKWNNMGSYKLLTIFVEHLESDNFIENTLLELVRKNPTAEYVVLLDTIRELDRHAWNLKRTSLSMYIHYNTIKYRYHRIQEILGIDLNDASTRFNLSLAVKLLMLKGR